jgi:hypothetical protein
LSEVDTHFDELRDAICSATITRVHHTKAVAVSRAIDPILDLD